MKINQYKITAPGAKDAMIATYIDGELSALEGIQYMGRMWEDIAINAPIPAHETQIQAKQAHYEGLVCIEPCQYETTGEKISLFCRLYRQHRGSTYTVFPADARYIAMVPVSPELLMAYFTNTEWWGKQPKSIRNYASNINEIRQLIKPKEEGPKKRRGKEFPNDWDRQYENTLSPTELPAYWAHLRQQGLAPVRENGQVIKWAKAVVGVIILLLLCSGCLTPERVQRYISKYPNAVELQYDTVYQHYIFHDTLYLPQDSLMAEWEWGSEPVADTAFSSGRQSIQLIRLRIDTVYRYRIRATLTPDTLLRLDTLPIPCPSGTATVSVARAFPWWGWLIIIASLLIIKVLWQRK